jgi:3-oxoacyl-[acyl-carrier-protein] synthase II
MALLAASLALKDAKVSGQRQGTTGIIVATGYGPHRTTFGFLDTFVKEGNNFASPTLFASSVHNAAAAYAAILFRERGPSLTVSQFEMSVSSALLTAWCWLEEGRVDSVLFGAVDEYSDVLGYCWKRYFGIQETSQAEMRPLDFERQSAIPGEGSVFFVLTGHGNHGRYGCITGVHMGFADHGKLDMPEEGLLILGADGHKGTGRLYAPYAAGKEDLFCHTPSYGSLPIGPAFDIAIAADRIGLSGTSPPEKIGCLKIGGEGELCLVTLARE